MIGSRIHLRLFIDGLEVPISSASVTFAEGKPSQAGISIIAMDEVHEIKPRAFVALFYYDSSKEDFSSEPFESGEVSTPDPSKPVASIDEYKSLFLGELRAISYQKRPSGRGIYLTCVDFTSYLDAIKMYGANFSHGGIEQIENAFQGAALGKSKSTTATGKDLKTNLVSWIGGQFSTDSEGNEKENVIKGVHKTLREVFFSGNYFYAKAFNRLRLDDQFVGLADDLTSVNLFDLKYFKNFYDATLARQGSMVSMRDVLNTLLAPIMYTYVTIPSPRLDKDGESRVYDTSGSSLESKLISRSSYEGSTLNQFVIKPDCWFLAPPSCNLIFPHMYSDFQISRDYLSETTRFILRTDDLVQGRAYRETAWNYVSGQQFSAVKYIKPKRMKDRLYAPDIEEFNILTELGGDKGYLSNLNDVLMNHERFTGPQSSFAYSGALGQYVSKKTRNKYLSFFTDYMFWKYRFSQRSATVTMAFNPNIVAGFPAVIFDRPLTAIEKAEGKYRKHFIGHVVSVTHSITTQGVSTQVQLVAVRPHDESIDFNAMNSSSDDDSKKGEGSSIEQIVMGFKEEEAYFDERYAPENIGKEFYSKVLGCDSIVDAFTAIGSLDDDAYLEQILDYFPGRDEGTTVSQSVIALASIYDTLLANQSDVNAYVNALTRRPKASMAQILGSSVAAESTSKNYPVVNLSTEQEGDGFLSSAVDPDSEDASNASYTTTDFKSSTSSVVTGTQIKQAVDAQGNPVEVKQDTVTQVTSTTAVDGGQATYGLDDELSKRRERVQAYLDAIKYRGIRG